MFNLPLHPTSGAAAGTGSELLCEPLAAERQGVNATGLRTALWRYDLGAELPLLAETCRSIHVHSHIVWKIKSKRLHFRALQTIAAGSDAFSLLDTSVGLFPSS